MEFYTYFHQSLFLTSCFRCVCVCLFVIIISFVSLFAIRHYNCPIGPVVVVKVKIKVCPLELQAKVAFAKKKIARVLASLMCRILIQAVRVLKYFKHVSHTLS